jgi:predicted transcriptional regulator of viral defense system
VAVLTMRPVEFFGLNPVFTRTEFAARTAADETASRRTVDSLLAYHVRTGRLLRLRRGLYAVVGPGASSGTQPVDPFLVAAKLAEDAVLAYHTALEFHGKAYSVHERLSYLTASAARPFQFRSQSFRGVPFPRALVARGQGLFEVKTLERAGVGVRVTSLERSLVDVLDRPDLGGGWEEVWRSLELVEFFDLDRVIEYALLLENATTAAKVGLFLKQHRDVLMVEDKHLQPLRERRPRSPHYLERQQKKASRLVAEWNLIVPQRILDRAWEEVL